MNAQISIDLKNKVYEIAGRENGKKIFEAIQEFGTSIIAELSGVSVSLPDLEIKSVNPYGVSNNFPQKAFEVARRHQFVCKIGGKSLDPMIQRIELDPFDYSDPEIFRAKITVIPVCEEQKEKE